MDDSPQISFLSTLLVFKNTLNQELIRSLHVYKLHDSDDNCKREEKVEREFVFSEEGCYAQVLDTKPFLTSQEFPPTSQKVVEGQCIGSWLCIFSFHSDYFPQYFSGIPPLLSFSRNPKLKAVPALAKDLEMIFQLSLRMDKEETSKTLVKETCKQNEKKKPPQPPLKMCKTSGANCNSSKSHPVLDVDLNYPPDRVDISNLPEDERSEHDNPGIASKKRKRAASEDVARLTLENLVKHFDLPIAEASRHLKVGQTVLKRKCRELGIPRWPHRKIKSLDSLIHDLQEESNRHAEDKAAFIAVARRQKMLENEKERIERKPFMEIQSETRRFRQDVFKRRHKAKAINNQGLSESRN